MSEHILVTKSDVIDPESWKLCLQVGYAIERLRERGDQAKLHPDALHFADLWEYQGEIGNGGHAQFYENEEDRIGDLAGMRNLLLRIGMPEHAELITQFERVVADNADRIFDLWASGDYLRAKEIFYFLDDRFAALEQSEGKLQDRLRRWLTQQPWIMIEDDQS